MNITNLEYSIRDIKKAQNLQTNNQEDTVHNWMLNIVKQEGHEDKVAFLSKRCMRRFIDALDPDSVQFWRCSVLLAAACLLVTSKIVSSSPLGARRLLKYSGGSFTLEEITSCELLLLSKLGWDVYLDCSQELHTNIIDNLNFSD